MTLAQLARVLGAELVGGAEDAPVLGVSGLEGSAAGHVVYVENERRLHEAEAGPALAMITPLAVERAAKPVLRVANPRLAFARALRLFAPSVPGPVGVHPTAIVGPGVVFGEPGEGRPESAAAEAEVTVGPFCAIGADSRVGRGTRIDAFAAIGSKVRIGPGCEIHPHVTVYDGVSIGARVVIQAGSVIGSAGFGYAQDGDAHVHVPHVGTVVVEDDVEIGANVTIDRATTGATVIGRGTKIDNLVHVAHNVKIGRNCLLAGQAGISGSVVMGDGVVLAGQVGVTDHITIGDGAQAGARAAVIRDVPAGTVVWGYPARPRQEQLRIDAAAQRLPELLRAVRDLSRRLSDLEKKLR